MNTTPILPHFFNVFDTGLKMHPITAGYDPYRCIYYIADSETGTRVAEISQRELLKAYTGITLTNIQCKILLDDLAYTYFEAKERFLGIRPSVVWG